MGAAADFTDFALEQLSAKTLTVHAYNRNGRPVVAYARYERGAGGLTAFIPARNAQILAKVAGRAFTTVSLGTTWADYYFGKYAGSDVGLINATVATAATASGAGVGLFYSSAVAAGFCLSTAGVGCVVVGSLVVAAGTGTGGWVGGLVGEAAVETRFENPKLACQHIGFVPTVCPGPV